MFLGEEFRVTPEFLERCKGSSFKLGEILRLEVDSIGQIVLKGNQYWCGISRILDLLPSMRIEVPDDDEGESPNQ